MLEEVCGLIKVFLSIVTSFEVSEGERERDERKQELTVGKLGWGDCGDWFELAVRES